MSLGNDDGPGDEDRRSAQAAEWRQVLQRHYDSEGSMELTTSIVFALADAMDVDPQEVREPVLYECVNVEALDRTFFSSDGSNPFKVENARVEFRYADYLVMVQSDGWIRVHESVESGS